MEVKWLRSNNLRKAQHLLIGEVQFVSFLIEIKIIYNLYIYKLYKIRSHDPEQCVIAKTSERVTMWALQIQPFLTSTSELINICYDE